MTDLHRRRRLAAGLFFGLLGAAAWAQPAPRSLAVVSEFARQINVVTFQESTGSRLGNNLRSAIPMPNGVLEKVALISARNAIVKLEPTAKPWLVAPLDSDLFDPLQPFTDGSTVKVPDDLIGEAKQRGNTHLLLMTRLRTEAVLRSLRSREGSGQLEGLGFFIDRNTEVRNSETNETSFGFMAPYMHVRLVLLELPSGRVVGSRRIVEGSIMGNYRKDVRSTDPWDAMKSDEKMRYIANLIESELSKAIPSLLTP